jgi:CRP-like cAMP-binding protein
MSDARLVQALRRHPLFGALDGDGCGQILDASSEVHLDVGDSLYESGVTADRVFVLLSGALQVEFPVRGKKRGRVVTIFVAPAFFGECQTINRHPWSGTGVALTQLTTLCIRRRQFLELLDAQALLTHRLYLELTRRYLLTLETLRNQVALEPATAVARYLVGVHDALHKVEPRRGAQLPLRQIDIALATQLSRETVNRVMSRWIRAGWVRVDKASVTLNDAAALTNLIAEAHAVSLVQVGTVPTLDPAGDMR